MSSYEFTMKLGLYLVLAFLTMESHCGFHQTQMDPSVFFKNAWTLAFDSYSNYMCSISRPPRTDSQNVCGYGLGFGVDCKEKKSHRRFSLHYRLEIVAEWLQKQNPSWYQDRYGSNDDEAKLREQTLDVILEELRDQLLRGFQPTKLTELKDLLDMYLMTYHFDRVIKKIYRNHMDDVKTSTKSMLPFYVKEETSSIKGLIDADLRILMIDVISAANGMDPQCTSNQCDIDFQDMKDFHDRQLMTSLPMEMSAIQKKQAVKWMEFFLKSKMDSDKTKAMLSSFVQGSSSGLDVGAICFALNNYKNGSKYCGVKYLASELYNNLDCDNHILYPSQLDLISKPQLQCGISELLTRTKAAEESNLLAIPGIVGGHLAGDCRTYPWMARVIGDDSHHCGGAILDAWHIMTAAHCVYNKKKIIVFVGMYDRFVDLTGEQMFSVNVPDDVFIYPGYRIRDKTNDMAVLKLPNPIDLSVPCAKPACLDPDFKVVDGMTCEVARWGVVDITDLGASRFLRATPLPVYNGPSCVSTFHPRPGYLNDATKQLCAGDPVMGGVVSCDEDSGGPLMCQRPDKSWVVVGVSSYGQWCSQKTDPEVYANVALYYDWIQQQLQSNVF